MQNKRYYWLKLKNDFFEGDEINWLEEQENGAVYILFYLKLCLWSLRSDGVLMRRVGKMEIPYDTKKLAEITGTPLPAAETDRKSTRLNSSHTQKSRMPSSA